MIITLKLTNFKRHEALQLDFTGGLVALKGANEAGKSTVYHAVLYALYGARALPMTLAQTVTYGKPESSLRVQLVFSHGGVTYTITRSKSGCELLATGLKVNGQSEVTGYVEGLFGVAADSATRLMIASQNGLRGALENKSAVALIEKLSNLGLVDDLIDKVRDQLPTGSVAATESTVAVLSQVQKPVLEVGEETLSLTEIALEREALTKFLNGVETQFQALDVPAADRAIQMHRDEEARVARQEANVLQAKARLEQPEATYDQALKESLQVDILTVEHNQTLRKKYLEFASLADALKLTEYDDTLEKLLERIKQEDTAVTEYTADIAKLSTEKAVVEASVIRETACGLCGKDLQNVPEVVAKNAGYTARLEALAEGLAVLKTSCQQARAEYQRLNTIRAQHSASELLAARYEGYVTMDGKVPGRPVWSAPVPEEAKDVEVLKQQLRDVTVAETRYNTDQAQRKLAQSNLEQALRELMLPTADMPSEAEAIAVKVKAETLRGQISATRDAIVGVNTTEAAAKHAYDMKVSNFNLMLKAYEDTQVNLTKLREVIAETQKYNALLAKLREARPLIASQLWATVLSAISHYFSDIRGTRSVVTMTTDGFLVDGKPAEALSGSTLDSLGLAIRIALGKTFLPSVDFLMLDEPAAGMDDARETAMLGVLSACNYSQVIVVTHSVLADAVAATVLQL